MAYVSYDKLWRSDFYKNVSTKDRVVDTNFKYFKLKVNENYKKNEKIPKKI